MSALESFDAPKVEANTGWGIIIGVALAYSVIGTLLLNAGALSFFAVKETLPGGD